MDDRSDQGEHRGERREADPGGGEVVAVPYTAADREAWDAFIRASRNGTFLFERAYMDYHAERFPDASLLLFHRSSLVGVLPATIRDQALVSHAGLTYGGVISGDRMTARLMLDALGAIVAHARSVGLAKIVYKAIPHMYHASPAEEDLYALFRFGARLVRRDVSSALAMDRRPQPRKGRRWALSRARRLPIAIEASDDYETFMAMEEALLTAKYGTRPVHTAAEMRLLASRFPDRIRLFAARLHGDMVAGLVVYETPRVAHAQYMASTAAGREAFALDRLVADLLDREYRDKPWFDFGISTERAGLYLNEGLIDNKESWGARATVYDTYELDVTGSGQG